MVPASTLPVSCRLSWCGGSSGPSAIRLQKELMLRWRYTDLATAVTSINAFAVANSTGEPQEDATAFLEKRPPRFRSLT